MVNVAESAGVPFLKPPLVDGVRLLSSNQTLTFQKYVKQVLPLDGYVFWLAGETMDVAGSLHYSSSVDQREDETIAINQMLFTTDQPIRQFNDIDPQTIWIATFDGVRFSFSRRGPLFASAGLYHYQGEAVYAALASQLVNDVYGLLDMEPIVSNSLPIWLSLVSYSPVWMTVTNPQIALYPSFLSPANLIPPYGTVHIVPEKTTVLQSVPALDSVSTHQQTTTDYVKLTLYGLDNQQAMDFVDTVNQYFTDDIAMGLMNMPVMRDEKRPQPELQAIAMKKTIEYQVSYTQARVRNVARQQIEKCVTTYTIGHLAP
jgi:hypothetical protein